MIKKRSQPKQIRKRTFPEDDNQVDSTNSQIKRKDSLNIDQKINKSSTLNHGKESDQANTMSHKYLSSGTAKSLYTDTSTRQLDVDVNPNSSNEFKEGDILTTNDNGQLPTLYKGSSDYIQFVNPAPKHITQQNASAIRAGPLKGQGNVRITCRMDYQPDICKDYKETGYCGYGDSCKFLHDRGDYKQGWQIDKEWDLSQSKKSKDDDSKWLIDEKEVLEEEEHDDDLPFACYICRGPFKDPIVTKCQHYFCELCAIKSHKKSPKCQVCGVGTGGVFAIAKYLLSRIKERDLKMEREGNAIKEKNDALGNTLL